MTKIEIKTGDGVADCYTFQPVGVGKYPGVMLFMDGVGIRKSLNELAQRFAEEGYFVLMPNLFYRIGEYEPFDPLTCFQPGPERDRLFPLIKSVTNEGLINDCKYFIDYLLNNPNVSGDKLGTVGYCLGGRSAMVAAVNYPENIAAAASIHGGSLVTDNPDSPHLGAGKIKGRLYVGIAGLDRGFTTEHTEKLRTALKEAGTDYEIEVYLGANHGFAMKDTAAYDPDAENRHFEKVIELFKEKL